MPIITPYAKLRASVNAGAAQSGGIVVPASATVQFSFESTVGWQSYRLAIVGPPTWTGPAGWTNQSGVYVYTGVDSPPAVFTLPAISVWGKFMCSLTVNDGLRNNEFTGDLVDEATALSMLSPNGVPDIGHHEAAQFDALRSWTGDMQRALRAYDAGFGGGVSRAIKDPVRAVSIGDDLTLAGEQYIDDVFCSTGKRVLAKDQSDGAQNGIYICDTGSWSRAPDFSTSADLVLGTLVFVAEGTSNTNKLFALTVGGGGVLGTTPLAFADVSSGAAILSDDSAEPLGAADSGTSNNVSRADHVHDHGLQGGADEHSEADASTAGFMSAADKAALDALVASPIPAAATAPPPAVAASNDAGFSVKYAREDHTHGHGVQMGGSLHSIVVSGGSAGFMSGADKALLDAAVALPGGMLARNVLTTAGTAVANVDTLIYTVPASPTGNFRALLAAVVGRLKTGLTGAGTVTVTVGTTSGGNDLQLAKAVVTATSVGTDFGIASAELGSAFAAANVYNAKLAAGATVYVRMATTGTVTVAPTFEWNLFGALMGT